MTNSIKLGLFFSLVCFIIFLPSFHKKLGKAKHNIHEISENNDGLYKKKFHTVYSEVDSAYRVSDALKNLIEQEKNFEFNHSISIPIISLKIDPKELWGDQRGIVSNGKKKGQAWERAGHISYYKKGNKTYHSFVGVRMHGGSSRESSKGEKSFRLYFRKRYGKSSFVKGEGITYAQGASVKRMVLRRDRNYNFTNDLSFFLIKQLGGHAPNIAPVAVYLNGEFYAYQFMTEHLSKKQFAHSLDHDDFLFYKLKGDNDSKDHLKYENLIFQLELLASPIQFSEVAQLVDIDSFTANLLIIMYLGVGDWAQGVFLKEKNNPWQLISWDFDMAFTKYHRTVRHGMKYPWQLKSVGGVLDYHLASFRHKFFSRLINENEQYRRYFENKLNDLFDDILPSKAMNEKIQHYKMLAEQTKDKRMLESLTVMKDFFKHRKKIFCTDLKERLNLVAQTCRQ